MPSKLLLLSRAGNDSKPQKKYIHGSSGSQGQTGEKGVLDGARRLFTCWCRQFLPSQNNRWGCCGSLTLCAASSKLCPPNAAGGWPCWCSTKRKAVPPQALHAPKQHSHQYEQWKWPDRVFVRPLIRVKLHSFCDNGAFTPADVWHHRVREKTVNLVLCVFDSESQSVLYAIN